MASVTTPDPQDVLDYTGISGFILGDPDNDKVVRHILDHLTDVIIPDAVVETALAVGESTYDSTGHTARVASALKNAVKCRAGAIFLTAPAVQKVTGTNEPILMESAGDIMALADRLLEKAQALEGLATAGIEEKPFARPSASASTFTVSESDRTPSERNTLLSEVDDISAWDVDQG